MALCEYITETLSHIETVTTFCKTFPEWMEARKTEFIKLNKDMKLDHLTKVLNDTLEKLDHFFTTMEKLAVTSVHVFSESQVLQLPKEVSLEPVQDVIIAAHQICPLLLEFKRDAKVFIDDKPQNVEVLKYQLDRYIQTSKKICDTFEEKSSISSFPLMMNEVRVDINMDLPESDIHDMLCRINQLSEIRMDPNFRMVFLFQRKSCSHFIKEFQNRQPRMQKSLQDLKQCSVQLDKMNKGSKISRITGGSVGAVGGVLSIVGIALTPVTAGASLGLVIGGATMGILSGTNKTMTKITKIGVNRKQKNKTNDLFRVFMEDMKSIQGCLGEVISQPTAKIGESFYKKMCRNFKQVKLVGKKINSLVKEPPNVNFITGSVKMITQGNKAVSKAPKTVLGMGKTVFKWSSRVCLGTDIISSCEDIISLAKGKRNETSNFIDARVSIWESEMNSWQNIYRSLNEGLKTSDKKKAALEMIFYPEIKTQKKQSVSFEEMKGEEREMTHKRQSVSFVEMKGEEREKTLKRQSVSFGKKQERARELKHKGGFYLFIVFLGGIVGFAAWVSGALCGLVQKFSD